MAPQRILAHHARKFRVKGGEEDAPVTSVVKDALQNGVSVRVELRRLQIFLLPLFLDRVLDFHVEAQRRRRFFEHRLQRRHWRNQEARLRSHYAGLR